jgi:hypothetical protein
MWENCHDYDPEVEKQVGKPARTALTNEQKAKRLEQMAESRDTTDAALLRESAAMLRERDGAPAGEWIVECRMRHKDHDLLVSKRPTQGVWYWQVWTEDDLLAQTGHAPTLDAAKAAAIAWVDGQEGK